MAKKPTFNHLHVHSHYSLLGALPKIPELIKAAKKDKQKALAITEAGSMYSTIEFYKTCNKEGIKPIIGVDFYLSPRTRFDTEHRKDNPKTRLVLLAKNETGYKNLIKMVSKANIEGFYYKPRIDRELMEEFKEGLIAILPSFASDVSKELKEEDKERALEHTSWYKQTYGDDLYFEITHHPEFLDHTKLMDQIKEIAKETNVPLVAAHDVYYMKKEDFLAREICIKIGSNRTMQGDEDEKDEDFSFLTQKVALEYFKDEPEAIANIQKIVDACNVTLELGNWTFPNFPKRDGKEYCEMLREDAEIGLRTRKLLLTDEMQERIDYELDIIKVKGYCPYFLVVADLMNSAKEMKIPTNTRGSAAGSFVSYLIGISEINPLDYNLPFERFLNPERPSPPDVDMDIADNRRDDLIDYARRKYGANSVAQIGTFGTMAARAAVRDVARALGFPYSTGDHISKMIPMGAQGFPMTIKRALKIEADLKKLYDDDHDARTVMDFAMQIEGNARHIGVHAAGVVISPTDSVTDFVPIQRDPKGGDKLITQYDMHAVEDAGLLKYDFLGLKNLAVVADAVKRIEKIQGITVDHHNLPLDDEKTYKMLTDGSTMGVFQLASAGMTKWLMELRPTTVHDINAMVALYRPGPMEFIPDYIERKRDPSKVTYVDERLAKYLEPTFGILIYQDDVMLIAVELAGYSWGEADKFRKAMGKKIPEEMAKQKGKFRDGCIERGMDSKAQKELWDMIETFAAYGFNKAHSVSYGNLAYKTAYLKANYPLEFMSALLTADSGDTDKISEIVSECRKMGITILPPDVNESFKDFTVVKDAEKPTIRFGLSTIKNFGESISESIVDERKENGRYKNMEEFLTRITDKNLNRRSIEALIKSGGFDSLDDRSKLFGNLELLLDFHKEYMSQPENQDSLFVALETNTEQLILQSAEEVPSDTKLAWEKELLGLYVSGHPLDKHKEKLDSQRINVKDIATNEHIKEGTTLVLGGIIEEVKQITTKKGDHMAFVRFADFSGDIETVVFPRTFAKFARLIQPDVCVRIKGNVSKRNDETSIIIDAIKPL